MKHPFIPVVMVAAVTACGGPLGISSTAEEGVFPSGDIELHYVLDFPLGNPPFPAVVMGHGSGPKTIDDLRGFATRMLDNGMAVLRYDKRGTGESGGEFTPSNTAAINTAIPRDYAPDMAAGFRFLAARTDIDRSRIGFMGESQAGWVIPPAAASVDGPAFLVILSGPVMPLGNVGVYEQLANSEPSLPSDSVMARLERQGMLRGLGFDPTPFLDSLRIPGLWIYGARDRNVPAPASARIIDDFATRGYPWTEIVYPNGDHGLRDADSGSGIPWWDDVSDWLSRNLP